NGDGMAKDVVDRAFDPFFTTKEPGHGTGLGLSQVYGFVKQSGGHIKLYSEPKQGTTVKIYLPRAHGVVGDAETHRGDTPTAYGRETILVVEDDADVRAFVCESLRELNYNIFEAGDGIAALKIVERQKDIDLLLTDVILPGQNGRELAKAATKLRPELRVL